MYDTHVYIQWDIHVYVHEGIRFSARYNFHHYNRDFQDANIFIFNYNFDRPDFFKNEKHNGYFKDINYNFI